MCVDDKTWGLLMDTVERIEKKVDKINGRVYALEKWKWGVMGRVAGGAAVVSLIVGVIIALIK